MRLDTGIYYRLAFVIYGVFKNGRTEGYRKKKSFRKSRSDQRF
jgi:hypothetical protein